MLQSSIMLMLSTIHRQMMLLLSVCPTKILLLSVLQLCKMLLLLLSMSQSSNDSDCSRHGFSHQRMNANGSNTK
jgi:hypothetical protein